MFAMIALAVMAMSVGLQETNYRADLEKHRADRVAELKADDGWLAVAGLFWLKPGVNVAGSAPSSDIVLPSKAPARLGTFQLEEGRVSFTADPGSGVTSNARPVTTIELRGGGAEPVMLAAGDLRLFVIRRGERFAIRMRDLNSPARAAFKGLHYFPIQPSLVVKAKYVPYEQPRKIPIPNVLGETPEMESPGYVTFTLEGRELRLEPVYETSEKKDLFFIFKDLTSLDATYPAGRFLHAALPVDGQVILDFNRAYNPPCAFTEFATCPLPPRQNQLPVRIEAGELAYH
jgi:uncharacterized protein (DUF1684 family)